MSLDGVQHPDLLTGDLVRVRGVRSGQKFKLPMNTAEGVGSGQTPQFQTTTAAALQVLQYAPLSNTLGPQKTVVVLVNFTDAQLPSVFTRDWVKQQMDASSVFFLRTRTSRPRW